MTLLERVLKFISKLTHTGDYAGQRFVLRSWQEDVVRKLFGTLRPDGSRQYRKLFWAMPRKTGKSEWVAAIGLFLLMGQGKRNQRIYCASGDFKQAGIIFAAICEMVRADPELSRLTKICDGYKKITFPRMNCTLEVLSSVPKSKHGLSPTAVLIDELHVVPEALVNVLTTGFGPRKDPLTIMITTAGDDQTSLCYDEWQYALQVRDGIINDPSYLAVIYAADPEDDWTSEATWHKANPALSDFCSIDFIREEYQKAVKRPRFVNVFKQLFLNLWVSAASSWLSIEQWDTCGVLTQEDCDALEGKPCWCGLDLGITGDLSAFVALFPNELGGLDLIPHFWAPTDGRWREEQHHKTIYEQWAYEGFLTLTEGASCDHQVIEDEIVEWNERFPIKLLVADRAFATQILSRLFNMHELNVKGIPQGPVSLNESMVKFESMMLDKTLRHGRHPIMRWMVSNGKVKKSSTGLLHLDKSSETKRIDGLSGSICGVAGWLKQDAEQDKESIYEKKDLLIVGR